MSNGPPTPGPEHAKLKPFEGKFKAKVTIHMGPEQSFVTSGIMKNTFELGGLYLAQDFVGDQPDGPFPGFLGKGFWGYNTATGKYEGFWVDNASTAMQTETGDVDADGKLWTMFGEYTEPSGNTIKRRSEIKLIDNDSHRMDTYVLNPDGSEFCSMEIEYERA